MFKAEEIIAFAEKNKPVIWGLFLSTIIFKFAVGNIFFGILGVLFLVQVFQNKKISFNKDLLPIAIYFLWGVVSLFWTTNAPNTISGISQTLPLVIIPVFISQYATFEVADLSKTIKIFGVCLLLYFLICFVNAGFLFLGDHKISHFFYHKLVSVFDNNAIYISLATAVCILINFALPKKGIKDYVLIFLLGIFLLFLASKNIIVTTFILFLLIAFSTKNNYKFIYMSLLVIGTIALCVIVFDNPVKTRFIKELNFNLGYIWHGQDFYAYRFSGFEVRLFQWRVIWEMIVNNQIGILGLGLNNVDYLIAQYFSYYNLYKGYFYINFHNQYLQTFGELGYIGLGILISLFLNSIYRAIRYKNGYQMLFITLFAIAFFTESFLSRQKGVYLFAICYSLVNVLFINSEKLKN